MKYADLSKEILCNFLYFAKNAKISKVAFLLDRKNKDYGKYLLVVIILIVLFI